MELVGVTLSRIESTRILAQRLQFIIIDEARCKSPWLLSPLRDLTEHERIGHTCVKHIGLSLADLRRRLITEPKLEASCFWSINAARAAVSFLTMYKLSEIIHWIQGADARVVFEGAVPAATSIGYVVTENDMILSRRVRMVLQRLPSSEVFGVVTAYPIR